MNARRWLFVTAIAVAIAPAAFADGIVLPPTVVLRLPEMHIQRALIVHRDGVEKLVVESPFEGEGDDVAWILPVPSEPLEVGKASPGLFTTLQLGLRPRVRYQARWWRWVGVVFIIWSLFILAMGRFEPKKTLVAAVGLVIVVKWGLSMIPGHLGADIGPSVAGVKAGEVRRVGSYDVRTLEADSAERLNAWLSQNGYRSLPDAGVPVVDDYVAQGWKFVVARLRRKGGGLCRPHPLAVSFKAMDPVYPMRLTQLAGSDLELDLFVMADRQVKVDGMTTLYSDRLVLPVSRFSRKPEKYVQGKRFYTRLGLPSLVELAGTGCVVTWLHGDLANARLDADLKIEPAQERATRPTVYSEEGVAMTARSNMLLAAGIVLVAGTVVYVRRKRRWARALTLVLTLALGAGIVAGVHAATWRALPHVKTLDYRSRKPLHDAIEMLKAYPEIVDRMTVEEIEEYLAEALVDYRNPYTGEPLTFEEGPGDVVVGRDEVGVYYRTFDGGHWLEVTGEPHEKRITGEIVKPRAKAKLSGEKKTPNPFVKLKNSARKKPLTRWQKFVRRWWPWG